MSSIIRTSLILMIKGYRRWISPLLGPRCRFYPTCSEYAMMCLQKDRLAQAVFKIVKRIISCNPFHPGGVDIP